MIEYMNSNFDIQKYIEGHSIGALDNISKYLKFAVRTTITNQIPNISQEKENENILKILNYYFNNRLDWFTRKYGIRENINLIGRKNMINLFVEKALELRAFHLRVKHLLIPETYEEKLVYWVTEEMNNGYYDTLIDIISNNSDIFNALASVWVDMAYFVDEETKSNYKEILMSQPKTYSALENLFINMNLDNSNKKIRY